MQRHRVRSAGVELNVATLGAAERPAVVFEHGIRDVAASLLAVAEALAERFHVVLPDLRGHGDSGKPGNYALWQFSYDLHRVVTELGLVRPAIVGHSLGGQIAAHYAALFPEVVSKLAIVEGLGPPLRPSDVDAVAGRQMERQRLLELAALPERGRPLPDVEFAAGRLVANNPRLAPERARWLAEHCIERAGDGQLYWKFDQRVSQVWLGSDPERNRANWRAVACPTLVVTAGHADEYWRAQMPIPNWDARFGEAELADRLACFRNVRHAHIRNAGHMVHFDAPTELAATLERFLQSVG
jgi:pimeloyl-ACP methyl ester carboxylesterase